MFRLKAALLGKLVKRMRSLEDRVVARTGSMNPDEGSPERFDIIKRKLTGDGTPAPAAIMPLLLPTVFKVMKSLSSVGDNPEEPRREISPDELIRLEARLRELGASSIGYAKLPRRWVFREKAVPYTNAIVLSMKMDRDDMLKAPSMPTLKAVWRTYRDLGVISQKAAELLRRDGFAAYGGHPLNGLALYPPLAQTAGLGWLGLNGLIITPEHGPCVRLAAVFTSIENLPFDRTVEDHSWVADFCEHCRICVRKCPPEAIHERTIEHESGLRTCVDSQKCFPYFDQYQGCSICIAVCPFTKTAFKDLKRSHEQRHENRSEAG